MPQPASPGIAPSILARHAQGARWIVFAYQDARRLETDDKLLFKQACLQAPSRPDFIDSRAANAQSSIFASKRIQVRHELRCHVTSERTSQQKACRKRCASTRRCMSLNISSEVRHHYIPMPCCSCFCARVLPLAASAGRHEQCSDRSFLWAPLLVSDAILTLL